MVDLQRVLLGGCIDVALLVGDAGAVGAQSPATSSSTASSAPLRPGDAVRLRIWREPDLSGEFPVDQDGSVVLPRIGPFSTGGVPFDSVRTQLIARYSQYLNTQPSPRNCCDSEPSILPTLIRPWRRMRDG